LEEKGLLILKDFFSQSFLDMDQFTVYHPEHNRQQEVLVSVDFRVVRRPSSGFAFSPLQESHGFKERARFPIRRTSFISLFSGGRNLTGYNWRQENAEPPGPVDELLESCDQPESLNSYPTRNTPPMVSTRQWNANATDFSPASVRDESNEVRPIIV